jgi:putative membrane protein
MTDESPSPIDAQPHDAQKTATLAHYQTKLALDRNTLAWIRTTLTMASFGFGLVAFFRSRELELHNAEGVRLHREAVRMGTLLLILAIIAMVFAAGAHWLTLRRLRRGETPALSQWPLSITVALLFAVIGLVGLWGLFAR